MVGDLLGSHELSITSCEPIWDPQDPHQDPRIVEPISRLVSVCLNVCFVSGAKGQFSDVTGIDLGGPDSRWSGVSEGVPDPDLHLYVGEEFPCSLWEDGEGHAHHLARGQHLTFSLASKHLEDKC